MSTVWKTVLLFGAVIAFFALTAPSNHCEAEDTYYYAHMVEQGAWNQMFHQHHLLYLPVARGVYQAVQLCGFDGRALPVLIGVSMISAATVICLFATMLSRGGASRWWVVPLLLSYGFWRYACAAEIYLPALAVVCAAWVFASRPKGLPWAICCSVVALLLHLVSLPAVFAAGLLFIWRKEWKRAGAFYLITGLAVAAVYGVVAGTAGMVVFRDAGSVRGSLFEVSTWLKAVFAFGQNLLSGNFLFSIPSVADALSTLFPHQMLQEELFMGQQAGTVWKVSGSVTFCVALALLGIAVFETLRNRMVGMCPMVVWFVGNVAMAMLFEPTNPEMWIFVLLPFWFLVSRKVPLVFKHRKVGFSALCALLLLHNMVGGMAFVKSRTGDYCRQKASWVVENATADDCVVFADSHSFATYLQYFCPARLLDAKFQGLEDFQPGERVFVFSDLLDPLPAVAARSSDPLGRLCGFADFLRPNLSPVFECEGWIIYEWFPQSP